MRRICVFAGSNSGVRQEYREAARALGQEMLTRRLGLVYGGASVGLMREVAHEGLTELHEVASMHERKALMSDLADGFIALPGGFGTFDELFEIITWAQLGLHNKPVGLLDVANYFAPLRALVVHASAEGFIPPAHLAILMQEHSPAILLDRFAAYTPPGRVSKWTELPPEP